MKETQVSAFSENTLDRDDPLTLQLASDAPIECIGGKAHSLSRLLSAGFAVPNGYVLTTSAYRQFVDAHDIQQALLEASLPDIEAGRLSFEYAATRAKELFDSFDITDEVSGAISQVYHDLISSDLPIAVRSSATLEDHPEFSFAGQHVSYMGIRTFKDTLSAVQDCWASLWSERALSYRHRIGIGHAGFAMAVVIQQMVTPTVAGILFTANPTTGKRDEILIDASYGHGEAVVSGSIDPDEFLLDRETLAVKSSHTGANVSDPVTSPLERVQTPLVNPALSEQACLNNAELVSLAEQARAIERHFDGVPQDIEWALDNEQLWLLQSRPITNLPPEPLEDVRWDPPEPGAYLQRSQWVEHVPDPVCTLFEDLHMRRSLQEAWGRNLTRRRNHDFEDTQPPASFCLTTTVNGFAYRQVGEPPRTGRLFDIRRRRTSRILRYLSALRMYLTFVPVWRFVTLPRYLRQIQAWRKLGVRTASIEQLWKGIRVLSQADAAYWFNRGVWNAFALSRGTEAQLQNFLKTEGNEQFTSGQFLSGLKSPAFDGQVALHQIAELIRNEPQLFREIVCSPPNNILETLASNPVGRNAQEALEAYMTTFGHQLRTLDFGEPFEAEDPISTLQSLHAYLLGPELNPIESRRQLKQQQKQARRAAFTCFRGVQKIQFRWRIWIARRYYPYREAGMFHLGRAWTVLRPFALELGQRLTVPGTLNKAEDIFFLTADELGRAIRSVVSLDRLPTAHREKHYPKGAGLPELAARAHERRVLQERRKNLRPPFLIPGPPPWAPLESIDRPESSSSVLTGSPVSPGRVSGNACVITSVEDFANLQSGSILVCPTTTPAWTPLFPQIVGLVTDIGGILAHGSIVAREFGIPAVLGLGNATDTIQDGQLITVDGDAGTVELN